MLLNIILLLETMVYIFNYLNYHGNCHHKAPLCKMRFRGPMCCVMVLNFSVIFVCCQNRVQMFYNVCSTKSNLSSEYSSSLFHLGLHRRVDSDSNSEEKRLDPVTIAAKSVSNIVP